MQVIALLVIQYTVFVPCFGSFPCLERDRDRYAMIGIIRLEVDVQGESVHHRLFPLLFLWHENGVCKLVSPQFVL